MPMTTQGGATCAVLTGSSIPILRVQSINPPVSGGDVNLYRAVMFGPSPLTRRQREMLAVVVAAALDCHY